MPIRIALGLGATVDRLRHRRAPLRLPLPPDRRRVSPTPSASPSSGPGPGPSSSEVGGQRKLLQWTVPGLAHAFTFWGFTILLLTIIEAYGDLFDTDFPIPAHRPGPGVGFIEDFFAVAVLVALCVFTVIR